MKGRQAMKCKWCGKQFKMGINGTIHGCDECTGVERISDGSSPNSAWFPNDKYHVISGKRVTREQAREYSKNG